MKKINQPLGESHEVKFWMAALQKWQRSIQQILKKKKEKERKNFVKN